MGEDKKKICGFDKASEGEEPDLCEEPPFDSSGRCIFHTTFGKIRFWEALEKYYESALKRAETEDRLTNQRGLLDCRGFIFPADEGFFKSRVIKTDVDFSRAEFLFDIDFFETEFHGETVFAQAKFRNAAFFYRVRFAHKANFNRAQFEGPVSFFSVVTNEKTSFFFAVFKEDVRFSYVSFGDEGNFENASFYAGLDFYDTTAPEVNFSRVSTSIKTAIVFNEMDLGAWSFVETPVIKNAHFIDVSWRGTGKPKRNHTRDEAIAKDGWASYESASNVYRRLRRNFEEKLAYSEAGDFFIGQMIMYRKYLFKHRRLLRWGFSWLYNLFSRYRESIWLPLAWLLTLFVATSYFYSFSGQSVSEALRSSFLGFVSLKIDLTKGYAGWLIPSLQRIIVIPLITLFILALRRAFRR